MVNDDIILANKVIIKQQNNASIDIRKPKI